jgi:hypothetical protein
MRRFDGPDDITTPHVLERRFAVSPVEGAGTTAAVIDDEVYWRSGG